MIREVDIYKTIQGDTWDNISYKVYGEEKFSKSLIRANPRYMNIAIFSGGIELICPDIPNTKNLTLPPWRQS